LKPTENPIFAEERKTKILKMLKDKKQVRVAELCDIFKVSGATIRTYLRELQDSGLLTRTHGGAIEKIQTGYELNTQQRKIQNLSKKKKIAQVALNLINDGDKIILDTGTTTCELAKLLDQKNNITVLTNDLIIANILEDFSSIEIIMFGGVIRKKFHCSVGLQGLDLIKDLVFDKAFMGVNSFCLDKGATTPDIAQADTKKSMIKASNKVILLCDSSKIEKVSFVQFASSQEIDSIITDTLEEETKKRIEEQGIEVIDHLHDILMSE